MFDAEVNSACSPASAFVNLFPPALFSLSCCLISNHKSNQIQLLLIANALFIIISINVQCIDCIVHLPLGGGFKMLMILR